MQLHASDRSAMLVVEFEATQADMAAFQAFVAGRIRQSVRSPLYYTVLTLLAIIIGGLLAGVADVRLHRPTFIIVIALGVAFWAVISWLYRAAVKPLPDGSLVGRRRVELSEGGIRQIADLHDAKTRWPGVLSTTETSTHIFLMTDRLAGYIIPARAFADAAARDAFVAFARERTQRSSHDVYEDEDGHKGHEEYNARTPL
jgi:hypothetical protein